MTAREVFDYIVVGGGSAGCVVASRLSEDGGARVALVEAGPPDLGRVFEVPGLFALQQKSTTDWDLQSEPEPGLDRRRTYLPRGRVLGGTSSMNTMVYIRGHAWDYDNWASLGCDGWGYEDVLPYFRRAENNERGENRFHGGDGPLAVSDARSVHPLIEAWVAAAIEVGQPANDDFNGPTQEGFGLYQMTQRDGLRCSASVAYVHPAADRHNLRVLTSTQALRVILDGTRAVGVEVEHLGTTRTIAAEQEVILCGGAYLSPQLLMLSGIGPAAHLREVGVTPVVDLPVGEDLQDHPGCFLSYISDTPDLSAADTPANEAMLRTEGRGPLTWTEAGGFARIGDGQSIPDVQYHAAPGMFRDEGLATNFAYALSFGPYVNRPESSGRVTLRSAYPLAKPRIQNNFLVAQRDREILREGLRLAMEIANQPALRSHLAPLHRSVEAGLVPASTSDPDLDQYMRAGGFSFYHPSGTCAMGRVVDPALRVLGVDSLRVADTSIMPRLVGGNTNAPAIMIGEKASDLISSRAAREERSQPPDHETLPPPSRPAAT